MNHIKWAAWSVINIEALDRQQRRNYLKKVHAELEPVGIQLHVGGTKEKPYYLVTVSADPTKKIHAYREGHAFADACKAVLEFAGELNNVSSEDGGVRCAGDEAQGPSDIAVDQC